MGKPTGISLLRSLEARLMCVTFHARSRALSGNICGFLTPLQATMLTPSGPQSLKINLDYYDGHEPLLGTGAYATLGTTAKVEAFQKHGSIPLPDFLNYFLIRRYESPKYATYMDRLNRIDKASEWLEDALDLSNTINWLPGCKGEQEGVGEAVSLSVASTLFGLTAADWLTMNRLYSCSHTE